MGLAISKRAYGTFMIFCLALICGAVYLNQFLTPYSSGNPLGDNKSVPWVQKSGQIIAGPLDPETFLEEIFCFLFAVRFQIASFGALLGMGIFFLKWRSLKDEKMGLISWLLTAVFFSSAFYAVLLVRWWGYG